MNHLNEEQLVLYYYGEDTSATVSDHLTGCDVCRAEYRMLQRVLNTVETMPVPERGGEYGSQVWNRIRPRIPGAVRPWWRSWFEWKLAPAAAVACTILIAFLAGRYGRPPAAEKTVASAPVRERILLVAVGDHLERSQMVLAELVNAEGTEKGRVDISYEQETARELVDSNRLFRQTALSTGDAATATLLEELERSLLEIAHSPSTVSGEQLGELRRQIEDRGILFKVRVFASDVRQRDLPATVTN